MYLSHLKIRNHPVLKDIDLDFVNPHTGQKYSIIAFVGENGCGKTTLLNEIFEYHESKYIVDKESSSPFLQVPHCSLFLRQNSLAKNAMKESRELIDGGKIFPVNSPSHIINLGKMMGPLLDVKEGLKILDELDDFEIYKLYKEDCLDEIYCSQEVSMAIDGKKHDYDISKFSSGQQEVLLKLKDLKNCYANTDCVLLDEPETSLHPRWQKKIVEIIARLLTDVNGNRPQIILATHSEKVLESLIGNEDALIIRLYKEKGRIKAEPINRMDLCLPKPTFAELDYVIFKIDNYEYCSQLFDYLEWKFDNPYKVDRRILQSEFYNEATHYKPWYNDKRKKTEQFSLPTYVRNYFHHPKGREEPTSEEVHNAIELLRAIILKLKQKME